MVKQTVLFFLFAGFGALPANGQAWMAKCSPAIRILERSTETSEFQLVVRDQAAFLKTLDTMKLQVQLVRSYSPAGIVVVQTSFPVLQDQLLPLPEVLYADRNSMAIREELPVPGHDLFINKINALQKEFPAWNGIDRTISVKEYLFDTLDIDLWGRVAPVLNGAGQITPHAALMATLIAGAGNSGPAGRGVAWGARVSASDFTGLLPDADAVYAVQDISVQNHSYGLDIENYYSASAMAYDYSVALRPELLHVFSAGNFGDSSATLGSYTGLPGFANLSGSFKMAKNVLLAGAVDSFGQVLPFSSRGPAYDGRVKPDLVAFGQDGSSGAAALVSGTAAVLQQAYADKHQGNLPQAALIRALLLNGTDDTDAPGPDYASGFGNLNALRSAQILDAGLYREAVLSNADSLVFEVDVPAGSRILKITLAWDDPPAAAGTPKALVNDLDLALKGPGTPPGYWQPLILNTRPDADSLNLPAFPGIDTLNTVEQIIVANPESGQYKIIVRGRNVASGSQVFALAFHWIPANSFRWIVPTQTSPPIAGASVALFWEHSFDDSLGQLEFRYVDQSDWETVDMQVPLMSGVYRWLAPDTFALAQFRMTIGSQSFISDSFLVAPELNPRVGFFCQDSALLFWNTAAPQAHYLLWGLGDRYLEPLFNITDTLVVLDRVVFPQNRIAVSALANGINGLRSGAVDISRQGLDCYFRSFLANFDDQYQVKLQLQLGTTYGLQEVHLEKWQPGSGFTNIASWNWPFASAQFETTDAMPMPGSNQYRARLVLPDTATFISDTAVVYYSGQAGLWVYPNPVSGQGQIRVILQEPADDTVFVLFDLFGRLLLEQTAYDELETIRLPALAPGIYPYGVRQGGHWLVSGKLVIGIL